MLTTTYIYKYMFEKDHKVAKMMYTLTLAPIILIFAIYDVHVYFAQESNEINRFLPSLVKG